MSCPSIETIIALRLLRNCCCQYAVLMFFGAGAQVAMCLMFYGGAFTVSGTTVKLVRCCLA